jgi:hypothetical protein
MCGQVIADARPRAADGLQRERAPIKRGDRKRRLRQPESHLSFGMLEAELTSELGHIGADQGQGVVEPVLLNVRVDLGHEFIDLGSQNHAPLVARPAAARARPLALRRRSLHSRQTPRSRIKFWPQ